MAEDEASALTACVRAYALAAEQADHGGFGEAESLHVSDAGTGARLALYRCMQSAGWQPPPDVARQMEHDSRLLRQPGHEGRLPHESSALTPWPCGQRLGACTPQLERALSSQRRSLG